MRQQKEFWFKQGRPQPEWLFPNTEGGSFDVANVAKRYFEPCLAKAGLHRRRFHDLRHNAGFPIMPSPRSLSAKRPDHS